MSSPVDASSRPGGDVSLLRTFDEFEVGDTHTSRARTITESDVVMFTALARDSTERREDHSLAETILPLAYSIGLIANLYIGALRRILDLSFGEPVVVGDTIHVRCDVEQLGEWTEDYGLLTGRWAIVNQNGLATMIARLEAVWRRTPL
jgi:3-hydroxybutyryl-CoA dehydratase